MLARHMARRIRAKGFSCVRHRLYLWPPYRYDMKASTARSIICAGLFMHVCVLVAAINLSPTPLLMILAALGFHLQQTALRMVPN